MNVFLLIAETSTTVPAGDAAKTGGGTIAMQIFTWVLLFGGMYFVFLRPRNRRMKEARALAASLAVGDEVVLNSGIYGFVSDIDGDIVWLDIADGHQQERIEIRVTRAAVARKAAPAGAATDDDKK